MSNTINQAAPPPPPPKKDPPKSDPPKNNPPKTDAPKPQDPPKPQAAAPRTQDTVSRSQESHERPAGVSDERSSHLGALAANFGEPAPAAGGKDPDILFSTGQGGAPAAPEPPKTRTYDDHGISKTEVQTVGPKGENITTTTYTQDGVNVTQTHSAIPDDPTGATHDETVRETKNGREIETVDSYNDPRPIEEVAGDPKVKEGVQAHGDRQPTRVTHTTKTHQGFDPKETLVRADLTSYSQTIKGGDFYNPKDGKVNLPTPNGIPGQSNGNFAINNPASSQTLTYTTGKVNPDGKGEHTIQDLNNEVKVEGTNNQGNPAVVSQSTTQHTKDGHYEGATMTRELKGVVDRDNVNYDSTTPTGPKGAPMRHPTAGIPQVTGQLAGELPPGKVDVRQTVQFDANNHETGEKKTEYGQYANPTKDGGVTITRTSEGDGPATLTGARVSDGGRHMHSQSVMEGTKMSKESDTWLRPDGTRESHSVTTNDGKKVEETWGGTRPATAADVNREGDQANSQSDPALRNRFLQGGDPNAPLVDNWSVTNSYQPDGSIRSTNNHTYARPNGQTLTTSVNSEPKGGQRFSDSPWELYTGRTGATVLFDPNDPHPTTAKGFEDDRFTGRRETTYTEDAQGNVDIMGGDGLPKRVMDVLNNGGKFGDPGSNLMHYLVNDRGHQGFYGGGALAGAMAFGSAAVTMMDGKLPDVGQTGDCVAAAGQVLSHETFGLPGTAKLLGGIGGTMNMMSGVDKIFDGKTMDGVMDLASGAGGIMVALDGALMAAGTTTAMTPIGWGLMGVAGLYQLYQVLPKPEDRSTVPIHF